MRTGTELLLSATLPLFCVLCLTAAAEDEKKSFVPAKAAIENDQIVFRAGDEEAAVYRFGGDNLAKPILWPLKAPNHKDITRDWPMRPAPAGSPKEDHPHQKSAWFTYGDVIPEGVEIKHKRRGVEGIDFWAEGADCGRIVCLGVSYSRDEAGATTRNEWRDPDGGKIMDEIRTIQLFNCDKARLFVVDIDLSASVMPITFGDTKEGAFGVRVAHSMREDSRGKGHITNAEGKVGEKQCWGRISAWCDYSGPVEGDTVGIAIFAAPDNPLPSCWHSRGYGLMAANPFGRAKSGFPDMKDKKDRVHLDKGEHLKLRYGIFVHLGDVKGGKVAEAYELFKKMK
ncbi:MAG TPA: PmoA family protein [Gemmataceae bacterium]|jgi:hypothetical protein